MVSSPDLVVNGMRRGMDKIPSILAGSSLQLVSAPAEFPGFVLPDQPVVHAVRLEGLYGFRDGLAVGDADTIMVPLRRRLLALYSRRLAHDIELRTKKALDVINTALCRGSIEEVACHPDDSMYLARLLRNQDRISLTALSDGSIR